MTSTVSRRVFLAAGFGLGAMPAFGQAPDNLLAFFFRPDPGSTMAYQVTEAEALSGGSDSRPSRRWRYTLTVALREPDGDTWPATVTISDVTVEDGKTSSPYTYLYLTLARIAEGLPVAVRLDRRGGFVQDVVDWPTVKAKLKRALADRIPREEALLVSEILDRLDATQGSGVIGRVPTLISGGYAMGFRSDGSAMTYQDWVGGSAYIWPTGRTLSTHFTGQDRAKGLLAVDWSIATDPAAAARHLGPELRSLLAGSSSPDVASARSELDKALAGGVTFKEHGQVIYSRSRRIVSTYSSTVEIEMGRFRKERAIVAELISP
jgi:hypothetical protein